MERSLDPSSPFALLEHAKPIAPTRTIHVNFCPVCHHVWKAPAAAVHCINCTNDVPCVSLTHYETELWVL